MCCLIGEAMPVDRVAETRRYHWWDGPEGKQLVLHCGRGVEVMLPFIDGLCGIEMGGAVNLYSHVSGSPACECCFWCTML